MPSRGSPTLHSGILHQNWPTGAWTRPWLARDTYDYRHTRHRQEKGKIMHKYPQTQSSVGSSGQTPTTNVSMTPGNRQICHQSHVLCGCTTFCTEFNWVRNEYGPYARCGLDEAVAWPWTDDGRHPPDSLRDLTQFGVMNTAPEAPPQIAHISPGHSAERRHEPQCSLRCSGTGPVGWPLGCQRVLLISKRRQRRQHSSTTGRSLDKGARGRDVLEGGQVPPPPSRAPSPRPATVPLTPSASLNGICN